MASHPVTEVAGRPGVGLIEAIERNERIRKGAYAEAKALSSERGNWKPVSVKSVGEVRGSGPLFLRQHHSVTDSRRNNNGNVFILISFSRVKQTNNKQHTSYNK